ADPAPEQLVRAGVPADVVGLSRTPRDQRQALVSRAKRVRDRAAGGARDDAAAPDWMLLRLSVVRGRRQLEGACAVEDDEQLLVGRMAVRRSRERPGVQLDVLQPRPARAGGAPEVAAAAPAAQLRL